MLYKTGNPFNLNYDYILIPTQRLYIRMLNITDCAAWIKVRADNYDYLQEKEPIWDMDALTYQAYYRLINDLTNSFTVGNYYLFGIFQKDTDNLIGSIEISNLMYWPKQSATIGYWIAHEEAGQGYATEAVVNVTEWAFKNLNLVKIEAGTMVDNLASHKVLAKAGYAKEGLSHCYGEINGIYEDHVLWGITRNELNHELLFKA